MEKSDVLTPKGYSFYNMEDRKMLGNKREEFNIQNRSFEAVDGYFCGAISESIDKLLKRKHDSPIMILDLAGGTESRAVRDLVEKFGDKIIAVNIDLAQNINKGTGVNRVQGDAAHIPLTESCDIVYSRQFLQDLGGLLLSSGEHKEKVETVLSEIVRVLKPGGFAYLDDDEEYSGPDEEKKRSDLAKILGVKLEPAESSNETWGKRKFPNIWEKEIRRKNFLIIRKN